MLCHPMKSQFLGSSSGIYFVNTVHRAFAIAKCGALSGGIREGGAQDHPSIDECIVGSESPRNSEQDEVAGAVPPTIRDGELISYDIRQRGFGHSSRFEQSKRAHHRILPGLASTVSFPPWPDIPAGYRIIL